MENVRKADWYLWMGVGVAALLAANVFLAFSVTRAMGGEADPFKNLEITFLTTPQCGHCFDLQPLREYLKENGVTDDQIREVAYDSREGKKLVKKYEISRVPTALIPESLTGLDFMAGVVENLGAIKSSTFVVTEVQPPYIDLAANKTVGEFDLTIISDSSCADCYDITLHDDILLRLGMKPAKRTVVDISSDEGKSLVESYYLTAVPTILMRGDLESYETLQEIWPSVGTTEDDGTYVLRSGVANMGAYKRLTDGVIVQPEDSQAPATNS